MTLGAAWTCGQVLPAGSVAPVNEPGGMNEPDGMGRPSGPGFAGPTAPGSTPDTTPVGPPPFRPAAQTFPPPLAPPPNRLPAVLTVLALAVVAVIVVVGTVLANRNDVRELTPRPATVPVTSSSPVTTDRIEFSTSTGTGVLEIVDHAWDSDGTDLHAPGSLLTIAVRVTCESGVLSYGPDSFQAFDRDGDLVEPEVLADAPTAMELGTLSAGQHVDGTVAFDISRGGVTLLMSAESSRSVTALRVPD